MNIDTELHERYALLRLRGDFDTLEIPSLQQKVDEVLQGVEFIVVNLRHVKFINSTAIGLLIKIHKRCREKGGLLVVSQPSTFVAKILTTLGIDQLIPILGDNESAIERVLSAETEQTTDDESERLDDDDRRFSSLGWPVPRFRESVEKFQPGPLPDADTDVSAQDESR